MGRLRPIRVGGGRRPGPLAAGSCGRAGALCLDSLSVGFSLLLGGDERSPCRLPASWERVSCVSSFPGGPRQPRADVLLAEETAARRFVSPPAARPEFRQHAACCAELCCAALLSRRSELCSPTLLAPRRLCAALRLRVSLAAAHLRCRGGRSLDVKAAKHELSRTRE